MKPLDPPLRKVLIDSGESVHVAEWSIDSNEIDLDTPYHWKVRKYELHGGRQQGVDMIEVDNGLLSFKIIPTRGMNLWNAHCEGVRFGWDSPVEEVVHPQFVDLDSRGGLGWLDGFAEWINRCGLASNGLPGTDRVTSNTGEVVEVQLTLHGKVSYLPAHHVEVIIDPPPGRRIRIRGVVDETMMFGPRLRLVTEISTVPGSRTVTIEDEVRNLAATPQEMQLLYHCNFGSPLLGDGARFVAPLDRVTPRDARAAEGGMVGWDSYQGPVSGYVEQVYFLQLRGDEKGDTEAILRAPRGDRGVSLRFSLKELPYMTLWKNTAAKENGYVTGLEPGTNYPNLRSQERAAGRVPVLSGGESARFHLHVTALTSADAVAAAEARIQALQGSAKPQIDKQPDR
ncbi:MAG: aldose 1-epimerase family protein [Planctomycetota bacterium]|nr:aldose 1-epimerase family protein [Planctomycetota bacterium]